MLPLAFLAIAGGLLLLVAGGTGSSLASVVKGHPDGSNATTPTGAGAGATGGPAAGVSGGVNAGPSEPSSSGGLPTAALAKVHQIARQRNWSAGDWLAVIGLESGGNPKAINASSGAEGIGQALGATKQQYPKMVSPSAVQQVEGMAEYISDRYGTPTKALEHEHNFHWY